MFTSHPLLKEVLTEEEKLTLVHYLVKEWIMMIPKEVRAKMKDFFHILIRIILQNPNPVEKFIRMNLKDTAQVLTCIDNFTRMSWIKIFVNKCQNILRFNDLECGNYDMFFEELELDKYQTLFRFIIGKLADHPDVRDVILKEIASFVVQHSYVPDTGRFITVRQMLAFVWNLKTESLLNKDQFMESYPESDPLLVTTLVYLRSTRRFPNVANLEPDTPCALKVSGRVANIPEFLPKVISHIKDLQNIHVLELTSIDGLDEDLSWAYKEFATVLYQSPHLVSIELGNINPQLTRILMQNLPLSVKRLGIGTTPARRTPRGTYTFPPEVSLVSLHLDSISSLENLFRNTSFPNLKIISSKNNVLDTAGKDLTIWTKDVTQSIVNAVRSGRMPVLEELNIWGCCLKGCGGELVQILKAESFYSAEFIDAGLSTDDGQIILKDIQGGNLDHLEYLNLLDNDELCPLAEHFEAACEEHEITLVGGTKLKDMRRGEIHFEIPVTRQEFDQQLDRLMIVLAAKLMAKLVDMREKWKIEREMGGLMTTPMARYVAPDAARNDTLAALVSSFTREQTQIITTFICSLTQLQRQYIITLLTRHNPALASYFRSVVSLLTVENLTHESRLDNLLWDSSSMELPQDLRKSGCCFRKVQLLLEENFGKEIVSAVTGLWLTFTPEQIQILLTMDYSLTLQQHFTLMSNITPETIPTLVDLISSVSPEEVQTKLNQLTLLSRIVPEGKVSDIGNLVCTDNPASHEPRGNDVAQNMATLLSNLLEKQSSSTAQLETPSREASQSQFDFSSIRVPGFCTGDNSANQDDKQSSSALRPDMGIFAPNFLEKQSSSIAKLKTPPREAPKSQFNSSSIRVPGFCTGDSSVNQDEKQSSSAPRPDMGIFAPNFLEKQSSSIAKLETPSREAPQSQFNSSSVRVPGFCTGDSSVNQDDKQSSSAPRPDMGIFAPNFLEKQSSSIAKLETPPREAPQSQFNSSSVRVPGFCTGDSSVNQDDKQSSSAPRPDMGIFAPNFLEKQSSSIAKLETPPREAPQSQFNSSSVRVPGFCTMDNSANQNEKQSSSTAQSETPPREAPQPQFDFSSIRNRAHTFFKPSNSANQDEPHQSTEYFQHRTDAPQSQYDFSSVRNFAHTFFNTNNSPNQDEPQERKEDSHQKSKDYRDDLDLD